jgi:tellurite resistance protein TehA-like permease
MGAMAISTLAGTTLIESSPHSQFLAGVLPFLKGFTIFYWATATWWIPMLLVLGFWRYVYKRSKLAYHPLCWGAVFPLGMYATSTNRLSHAFNLPFLLSIQRVFVYLGLAAWAATFLGFLRAFGNPDRTKAPH